MAGGRLWDSVEDAILADAIEQATGDAATRHVYGAVGARLGRSMVACRSRAAKLDLRLFERPPDWRSADEDIVAATPKGKIAGLAEPFQRTPMAVYMKRFFLRNGR